MGEEKETRALARFLVIGILMLGLVYGLAYTTGQLGPQQDMTASISAQKTEAPKQ